MTRHPSVRIATAMLAGWLFSISADATAEETSDSKAALVFRQQIQPIFRKHCLQCHGPDVQEGDLRLDHRRSALGRKDKGKPGVIVAGKSRQSRLLKRISAPRDDPERMPPPDEAPPLSRQEVDAIRTWIDQGAVWPEDAETTVDRLAHWAFQPLHTGNPPRVRNRPWVRNPIDAFVLARLERARMTPAPPASRRAWLRRATLDLLGLPPEPTAVRAFLRDDSPEADARLIDRLLASPAYGERWGRHWLDLVRYADSNGYEVDGDKPLAWKYRDYVVRALNADLPYNRFILEQLAGDELPDATPETVIATGFYRVGPWDAERGASVQKSEVVEELYNQLDDLVSTTSQVFLGMTLGCARCHDHKFDPLTAEDYYSLVAVFRGLERQRKGRTELPRPAAPPRLLAGKDPKQFPQGYFFHEPKPQPPETRLLKRGNPKQLGDVVRPAVPVALVKKQPVFDKPDAYTSRRRISLARWIARPDNRLSARVIVNRVWQYHFGEGLVRTPNDFGRRGRPPTHPHLLDWLARWFVTDGEWSIKRLHRLIMTSNTYRMSKRMRPEYAARDPQNQLLWRFPYQRLEVEAIRDSMLAVSGRLNRQLFGASMYPHIPAAALRSGYDPNKVWRPFDERSASRRTLYAYVKRTLVVPLLKTLDFCDTTRSAARREITTVAPQALALLNGEFANRQARHFAARLIREAGPDPQAQIDRAFSLALARPPTTLEKREFAAFLKAEAEAQLQRNAQERKASLTGALKAALPDKRALWFDAGHGTKVDDGGAVRQWVDRSGRKITARASGTPRLEPQHAAGRPAIVFRGKSWFALDQKVLKSQHFTLFAVATDVGGGGGHRNLVGNWNGGVGNSGSSVFLGTTDGKAGGRMVRLSDDLSRSENLRAPSQPFLLTAAATPRDASTFQNGRRLGRKGNPLAPRRLDTDWTIGRQGTLDAEYWQGAVAEILAYDRALSEAERRRVERYFARKYQLPVPQSTVQPLTPADAHRRALAQMCRVLFNLNEFVYSD